MQATGALTKTIGYAQPAKGSVLAARVAEVLYYRTLELDDTQPLEQDPTLAGGFRGELKGAKARVDATGSAVLTVGTSIGWWLKHLMGAPATTGVGPYTHEFKIDPAQPLPACFGAERDYSSRIAVPGRYVRTEDLRVASAAFAFSTASPFQQATFSLRGMSRATLPATAFLGAVAAAPVFTGTGNGTLANLALKPGAVAETWTIECTATAANGGTFSVTGSVSGVQAPATVGVPYENDFLSFTLTDGTTDFIVGDDFSIVIAPALPAALVDGGHAGFALAGLSLVLDNGATEVCVESLNVNFDNDLDTELYCLNDGGQRCDLPEGNFIVNGDGVAQFDTPALMTKAMADESLALKIELKRGTGAGTAGNEKLTLEIPLSAITAPKPGITGPRGLKQNFSFRGFRNGGSEVGVKWTLLNSRANYNT